MSLKCKVYPATTTEDLAAFRDLTLEYYEGLGVNLEFQVGALSEKYYLRKLMFVPR